jgi:hypothetical protein
VCLSVQVWRLMLFFDGQYPRYASDMPSWTTALYTQVATNVIRAIMSPLDRLTPLTAKRPEPPA